MRTIKGETEKKKMAAYGEKKWAKRGETRSHLVF
jgi:hypothetical protein